MQLTQISVQTLLTVIFLLSLCNDAQSETPIHRAHAHNDYVNNRPLTHALDHGFTSIEVDVHLVNGQLLVGHTWLELNAENNLVSMYLDPLDQRVLDNNGCVYKQEPGAQVILMIDIKTSAKNTYLAIHQVLLKYQHLLTSYTDNQRTNGPVTVIISGNRPKDTLKQQAFRLAAMDGRMKDLESDESVELIPLISNNWCKEFKWRGKGPFPQLERAKLESIVKRAHTAGRKIRFWDIPDTPNAWQEFLASGVDFINTDQISAFHDFFRNHSITP
jgi:hypothetical protein